MHHQYMFHYKLQLNNRKASQINNHRIMFLLNLVNHYLRDKDLHLSTILTHHQALKLKCKLNMEMKAKPKLKLTEKFKVNIDQWTKTCKDQLIISELTIQLRILSAIGLLLLKITAKMKIWEVGKIHQTKWVSLLLLCKPKAINSHLDQDQLLNLLHMVFL